MGRFWFGVGLLAVFLGLSLWVGAAMTKTHEPIAQKLEQAAAASIAGDPAEGLSLARQAHAQWEKNWHLVATVSDHTPMDEIDSLFAQAKTCSEAGQTEDFAALCMRLSQLIRALAEAHSLRWWNLL